MSNPAQKSFLDPGYMPPVRKVEPVQPAAPTGEQLRDEALDRVLTNAGTTFRERATEVVRTLSGEITGEDIRCACEAKGVTPPHHNAWGGFVASLVKGKLIVPTGQYVPMKSPDSHARKTAVYRIGQ